MFILAARKSEMALKKTTKHTMKKILDIFFGKWVAIPSI